MLRITKYSIITLQTSEKIRKLTTTIRSLTCQTGHAHHCQAGPCQTGFPRPTGGGPPSGPPASRPQHHREDSDVGANWTGSPLTKKIQITSRTRLHQDTELSSIRNLGKYRHRRSKCESVKMDTAEPKQHTDMIGGLPSTSTHQGTL